MESPLGRRNGDLLEASVGRSGSAGTRLVFATTDAGGYLFVVVAEAMDGRDFIVTAREITQTERRLFRQRGH